MKTKSKRKIITMCGSTDFYDQMDEIRTKLTEKGFTVLHPRDTATDLDKSIQNLHMDESHKSDMTTKGRKSKYMLIISHLEAIRKSDAVLIANLEKNGKENYIGGNTFLEMGFALAFRKKIYVLNKLPEYSAYYDELTGMLPVVVNSDLAIITDYFRLKK